MGVDFIFHAMLSWRLGDINTILTVTMSLKKNYVGFKCKFLLIAAGNMVAWNSLEE